MKETTTLCAILKTGKLRPNQHDGCDDDHDHVRACGEKEDDDLSHGADKSSKNNCTGNRGSIVIDVGLL